MKKERSVVLVICCIIFLLSFIVLPPFFRSYIPKEKTIVGTSEQPKLKILQCSKYFKEELYKVSSNTKYINDAISVNTITYEKLDQVPEDSVPNSSITVSEELNLFKALNNVDIEVNDTTTVVTVNQDLVDNNPDHIDLLNYYQSLDDQKNYYETIGYKCNILES